MAAESLNVGVKQFTVSTHSKETACMQLFLNEYTTLLLLNKDMGQYSLHKKQLYCFMLKEHKLLTNGNCNHL